MGKALQNKPQGSLAEQIEATERRLLHRQQMVGIRRNLLTEWVRQQISSPMALLVAGGIGFLIGDLMRRKDDEAMTERGAVPTPSPFMHAVDNLIGWIRPIFTTEMEKVIQSFSTVASNEISEQIYRFSNKFTNPPDRNG
jgi:hypothetical protein